MIFTNLLYLKIPIILLIKLFAGNNVHNSIFVMK